MPPTRTPTDSSQPPRLDFEQLAAYLDGRLPAEERAAVEERLSRDDDALELLAEAARLREPETAAGEIVELAERRRRVPWIALVAAAAVVLAVGLATWWQWRATRELRAAEWIASLPRGEELSARLGDDWTVAAWSEFRNAPDPLEPPPHPPEAAAFRIGYRTVEVAAAARAGDFDEAEWLAGRIEVLYGSLEPFHPGAGALRPLRLALDVDPPDPQEVAEALRVLDEYHGVEPVRYFEAGRWAAGAHLAARVGDDEFFASRRFARGLREVQRTAATPALREAADRLGRSDATGAQRSGDLATVIALLGNGDAELAAGG